MSKFFIGQSVRVVGFNSFPELVSSCGVVTGIDVDALDFKTGLVAEGFVKTDILCPRIEKMFTSFYPDHLEPILYDGATPSEFSYSELMDNLRTKVQEEV